MEIYQIIAVLLTFSAVFSFLNYRFLKWSSSVGVMLISLVFSLCLMTLWHFGIGFEKQEMYQLMESIDFEKVMLGVLLGLLLFAGSLHIEINDLLEKKVEISILSTVGVLMSTLIVSVLTYLVTAAIGHNLKYIYCLLFGALISPTDPIAVLGILRKLGIPKSLETKIAGESLFNDGIGVVLFLTIFGIAIGGNDSGVIPAAILFIKEILGGIALGIITGWIAYRMLRVVYDYNVEVLITIALAVGGYSLASSLHISAPLAIVVAGLLIGNYGRRFAMSKKTREHLDKFWELVDYILNTLLYVLIGLEVIIIPLTGNHILKMVLAIPIVLLARFISVGVPICILKSFRQFSRNAVTVLTWGGLRGGISVALALSIPRGFERDIILTMTYAVVIFSVLVQGMTIGKLIEKNPVE
ncbi:MAG: sodium:proton antiporter [Thermodesulfovibrionales bacterium]